MAIYYGSTGYEITDNLIMGTSRASPGGRLSRGSQRRRLIARNQIVFNEVFYGGEIGGDGGGIYIASTPTPRIRKK